jgi:hypothetical protein
MTPALSVAPAADGATFFYSRGEGQTFGHCSAGQFRAVWITRTMAMASPAGLGLIA